MSVQQHEILERIESMLDHFLRMPEFEGDGLGRAQEKFSNIIKHIQELPFSGFEDLTKLAELVHDKFDPYRGHFGRASEFQNVAAAEPPARPSGATSGPSIIPPPNPSGARPVVSDRVKWKNPPSFDAEPFLSDPLVRAAFVDPEVLRKDPCEWPPSRPPKLNCSKSELLKLASRWDELGACMLLPLEQKNFKEAVGLFCVGKDAQYDRLIINPVTINSRMHSISKSTKELAPGCMLGLLHLEDDMMFRFQADDLTDFYYSILVSESRATRNAIRQVLHSHEVSHFRSYKPEFDGKPLLICLRTLAMGDNLAVEIAQQAHSNVLRQLCGALLPHETLRYRCPVPRSDFIELLAIDDHVGIQKLPKAVFEDKPAMRDTNVFATTGRAYQQVNLIQQEYKQKRDQTSGVF